MTDLKTQLHQYGEYHDEEFGPLTIETILEKRVGDERVLLVQPRNVPRRVPRWAIGVAAGLATLVLAGGTALLMRSGESVAPADEPSVPVTTAPQVPVTTVAEVDPKPSPDAAIASEPPTIQTFEEVATSVGTVTWNRLSGGANAVPNDMIYNSRGDSFYQDTNGTYVFAATDRTWRSHDGLTWTIEEGVSLDSFGTHSVDIHSVDPSWRNGSGLELIHTTDGQESLFALPAPAPPAVEGLSFELVGPGMPIALSGESVFVAANWEGVIPWSDIYGLVTVCDEACREEAPYLHIPTVQNDSRTLAAIHRPDGQGVMAELEITFTGTAIRFTDTGTGELVHEITSADANLIDDVKARLIPGAVTLSYSQGVSWIGSESDPFTLVGPHPGSHPWLDAIPDGGVGVFFDRDSSGDSLQEGAAISRDGLSWDRVKPAFVTDGFFEAHVWNRDNVLMARVTYRDGFFEFERSEIWESSDGLDWEYQYQYPASNAEGSSLIQTDSGLFSMWTRYNGLAVGYPEIQTSIDGGGSWTEIPGPPRDEYNKYPEGSWERHGIAGDLIWILIEDSSPNDATKILWVGKLEP